MPSQRRASTGGSSQEHPDRTTTEDAWCLRTMLGWAVFFSTQMGGKRHHGANVNSSCVWEGLKWLWVADVLVLAVCLLSIGNWHDGWFTSSFSVGVLLQSVHCNTKEMQWCVCCCCCCYEVVSLSSSILHTLSHWAHHSQRHNSFWWFVSGVISWRNFPTVYSLFLSIYSFFFLSLIEWWGV